MWKTRFLCLTSLVKPVITARRIVARGNASSRRRRALGHPRSLKLGARNPILVPDMRRLSRRTVLRAVLLVVFTLSGAAGLVYEVLWSRRLTHVFGSTTLAVSTVLAAFMGGLAAPLLLRAVETIYLALAPATERSPFLFFAAQFVLVGAVLAPPCALMGGTLPLLVRWLVGREEEIGAGVGTLYAANTLGAAV